MKKSTKTTKAPAPATKAVTKKTLTLTKSVAAKPAKKAPAKVTKKTVAATPAKAAAKTPKPAPESAVKPVTPSAIRTTITATIDIGFGNTLYLRGEGAGLSWDRGVLMNCVANDCWSLELTESARPIIYKFLVNDLTWSAGEDYTANAGRKVTVVPTFET